MRALMLLFAYLSADLAESAGKLDLTYPLLLKILLAGMTCLIGVVAAFVAGILAKRSQRLSLAILAGGGAFIAAVTVCVLLLEFVIK